MTQIRLALLGYDEAAWQLADAAARDERFSVIASFDIFELERLPTGVPNPQAGETWEVLLDGAIADGVLVAAESTDRRLEQLRKLAQEGVPVLVAHPCHDQMIVYYELDMIRQHSDSLLMPYIPSRWHPAVAQAARFLSEQPCGPVEQLVLERRLYDRTQARVCRAFTLDVDIVRQLLGEQTKIAAMSSAQGESPYASLGVQLSGPSGVLVRWSVAPVEDAPGGLLKLVGEYGQATLWMPEEGDWGWTLHPQGQAKIEQFFPHWNPAPAALESFGAAIKRRWHEVASEPGESEFVTAGQFAPTWLDAARGAELTDELQRSLKKGKTIELYYGEFTEHNVFKGRMAALGCGLLWLTLLTIVVAAVALKLGIGMARHWAWFLVVILGSFLALQFLKLVLPPDKTGAQSLRQEQEDPEAF